MLDSVNVSYVKATETPTAQAQRYCKKSTCTTYIYTIKQTGDYLDTFHLHLVELDETDHYQTVYAGTKGYFEDRISHTTCIKISDVDTFAEFLKNILTGEHSLADDYSMIFPKYVKDFRSYTEMRDETP